MSGSVRNLVFEILAIDGASHVFHKVGTSAEEAGAKVKASEGAFGGLAKMGTMALAGLAAGAVVLGAKTIHMAADFHTGLNLLVTSAGEAPAKLGMVGEGIKKISVETATSTKQLSSGMFMIESAGFHAEAGLKVMRAAAQGAKAEGADLGVVGNALTTYMKDYHLSADQAIPAMNALMATAAAGKMRMEDLAGALHSVLPIAAANKISFAEVGGAIATMTAHGVSAENATQHLSNLIRNLAGPLKPARTEMGLMGLSALDVSKNLGQRGLAGTLDLLMGAITKHMGPAGTVLMNTFNQSKDAAAAAKSMLAGMPPDLRKLAEAYQSGSMSAKDYTKAIGGGLNSEQRVLGQQFKTSIDRAHGFSAALKANQPAAETLSASLQKMTGGATGLEAALQLTGENAGDFRKAIGGIADASGHAGKNIDNWGVIQHSFNFKLGQFHQQLNVAGITIGEKLLGPATSMVDVLNKGVPAVTGTVTWLSKHKTATELLGGVITALLLPAMVRQVAAGGRVVASFLAQSAAGYKAAAGQIATGTAATVNAGRAAAAWVASTATTTAAQGRMVATVAAGYVKMGVESAASAVKSGAAWAVAFAGQAASATVAGAKIAATMAMEAAGMVASKAVMVAGLLAEAAAWVVDTAASAAAAIAENAALLGIPILIAAVVAAVVWLVFHWKQTWHFIEAAGVASWHFLDKYMIHPIAASFQWLWHFLWDDFGAKILNFYTKTIPDWGKRGWQFIDQTFIQPWKLGFQMLWQWIWNDFGAKILNFYTNTIPSWFRTGVSNVKHAFGGFANAVLIPVNWVIQNVWDNGIEKIWNAAAGVFGGPQLSPIGQLSVPGFARGGQVPGSGSGDIVPAMLEPGEFVLPKSITAELWPILAPHAKGFKSGGLVGDLLGGLGSIGSWLKGMVLGGLEKAASAAFGGLNGLLGHIPGSGTELGQLMISAVKSGERGILSLLHKKDSEGGPVVGAAKSQLGVPYSWGGGGPYGPSYGFAQGAGINGFDCSSLMQYAYWQGAHRMLPRTTYDQINVGKAIGSQGELMPGDLVFPEAGHVMMVATPGASGPQGMVEAPHTGANVRMNSFYGMIAARRILGYKNGGFIGPNDVGLVGEVGPELVTGGRSGVSVHPMGGGGHFTAEITVRYPDGRFIDKQLVEFQHNGGTLQSGQTEIRRSVLPSARTQ